MTEKSTQKPTTNRRPARKSNTNTSPFPPLWSIAAALILALVSVAALAILVIMLGGNAAPARPPQLVVLTAPPLSVSVAMTPVAIAEAETPEAASSPVQIQRPGATLDFVMQGPVLPTPYLTPTALSISVGSTVRVIDVGDQQLNVRELPGVIDVDVVFRAPENTLFTIVDGPSQGDGLTWWRIQDPTNGQRAGWAASNYLEVVPPEAAASTE
jgi:hypothetical protein